MNNDDDEDQGAALSSGLSRSYSEHANLILKHYGRRTESPRYTRSGPNFQCRDRLNHEDDVSQSEADDEDEAADPENNGRKTWRISPSTSEEVQQQNCRQCRKFVDLKLTENLSNLNLNQQQQQNYESSYDESNGVVLHPAFSSSSQNTTNSSIEQRCRIFDIDDDVDENFNLVNGYDDDDYRDYNGCKDLNRPNHQDDDYDTTTNIDTSLSTISLTTTNSRQRLNGVPLHRLISYEDWIRDKQLKLQKRKDEERKAEERKHELEELEKRAREEKEKLDYERFIAWVERKKHEKILKKQLIDKELSIQKQIENVEEKAKLAKDICLKQWYRKKEEQQKALEKKEQLKQKRANEEKQKRLEESIKAFEIWREKSKNTPRPATQGLLPHQKAKPKFTNPKPWQPLIDNASDESDDIKATKNPSKNQKNKKYFIKR